MMKKTLFLMRHGKAEQNFHKADFDRNLTERGKNDARYQATHVFQKFHVDLFIVSAASRTQQTFECINDVLHQPKSQCIVDEKLYASGEQYYQKCIQNLAENHPSVCFIGHNPTLIFLTQSLTDYPIDFIKTSGITQIAWDGKWQDLHSGLAHFEAYHTPK